MSHSLLACSYILSLYRRWLLFLFDIIQFFNLRDYDFTVPVFCMLVALYLFPFVLYPISNLHVIYFAISSTSSSSLFWISFPKVYRILSFILKKWDKGQTVIHPPKKKKNPLSLSSSVCDFITSISWLASHTLTQNMRGHIEIFNYNRRKVRRQGGGMM